MLWGGRYAHIFICAGRRSNWWRVFKDSCMYSGFGGIQIGHNNGREMLGDVKEMLRRCLEMLRRCLEMLRRCLEMLRRCLEMLRRWRRTLVMKEDIGEIIDEEKCKDEHRMMLWGGRYAHIFICAGRRSNYEAFLRIRACIQDLEVKEE